MDDAEDARNIDQAVKPLPAFASEAFDHAVGRCHCKRHHQQKAEHSKSDERSLDDVRNGSAETQSAVKNDICCEVNTTVEKYKQA